MESLTEKQKENRTARAKAKSYRALSLCLYSFVAVVLFSFCFVVPRPASAESPQETFKRANVLYSEGKFTEAASAYQEARAPGLRHWALEYNLGNAYFKTGQIGRAIAAYERAFRLNSGQRDVFANLRLATERVGDPVVPQSALPALAWRLFFRISINTLTVLASLLFLSLLGAGGLSLLRGKSTLTGEQWAALIMAFLIMGAWLAGRIYELEKPIGIIIAAPTAEVRSGPNTSYPASFTVPEGRHVLILKDQEPIDGWLEIGVPQEGLKGWVPSPALEVL